MTRYETMGRGLKREAMRAARARWDAVAKPLRGLGRLEDILVRIAGIQGTCDIQIAKRAALVLCADNGVVAQGVAQTSDCVTAAVADHIADGKASVNRMCARCGTDVFAVDIGIRGETRSERLLNRKLARGTKDFSKEPAMSPEQTRAAIDIGIGLVETYRAQGYTLFATGEMGIGNTTTASAVSAALLRLSADETVGRGAGLSDEGFRRKKAVVAEAIRRYGLYERSALDVLACVGGFDLAGMAGVFLGGARYGVPIVIDGMISAAAALAAAELCPRAQDCMIASHIGREKGMRAILARLGLSPVIDGDLALGEGTGAALLLPMLDMAESVYRSDETFSHMRMAAYRQYETSEGM